MFVRVQVPPRVQNPQQLLWVFLFPKPSLLDGLKIHKSVKGSVLEAMVLVRDLRENYGIFCLIPTIPKPCNTDLLPRTKRPNYTTPLLRHYPKSHRVPCCSMRLLKNGAILKLLMATLQGVIPIAINRDILVVYNRFNTNLKSKSTMFAKMK